MGPRTVPWTLLGLALLAHPATAADLPITQVTIGPAGALVDREGMLPAGDEVLSNIPPDIDLSQAQLTIEGIATPPALRLDLPPIAVLPPPDPAWIAREASARATFDACQPAIDLAELRIRLARAVLGLLPGPPAPASAGMPAAQPAGAGNERRAPSDLPLPGITDQQALLRFLATNLTRAQAERHAAQQARLAAQHEIEALGVERERQRPPQILTGSVRLPGAGGHRVHLRYHVDEAAWSPVYRVEVDAGHVTLVSEALVDVPRDQHWDSGRLVLETRSPSTALQLPDLTIPVLELGNEVVVERNGETRRWIGRYGGVRGSESAVDGVFRLCKTTMDQGGFWGDEPWTVHATAATLLAFLGAGYDHQTPNKYKHVVAAGLEWLRHQPVPGDLLGAALQLTALSEAVAMTNDQDLKTDATHVLTELETRVDHGHALDAEIFRRDPGTGPVCLGWVDLAVKTARAAGLDPTLCGSIQDTIMRLLPQLVGHGDTDAATITRMLVLEMHGVHAGDLPAPPISAWLEHVTSWLAQGRPELIHFATLALFQYGGAPWKLWNQEVRSRLVRLGEVGQRNGFLAVSPDPLGEAWTRAILTLPLEVYYRYSTVKGDAGLFTERAGTPDAVLEPLPAVADLAHHWPMHIDVGVQPLLDGHRSRVVLRRTPLPGPVRLRAAPEDAAGAWRVFSTRNPLAVPLLEGPIDVVVDGETIGQGHLPFTEPGAAVTMDLGRDDRVQVHRVESHQDAEAWGKRTRTITVRFTIDAPPGLYPSLRIDEAMPVPADASIQLLSLDPAIAPQDLDRRLVEDPFWHLDLDLRTPQAHATVTYQLRYPETVEPDARLTPPAPVAPAEHAP